MTDRRTHNVHSLEGASVIVTRPAATAAGLVRRARSLGAHVVRLPGMRLCAIDDPAAAERDLDMARKADTWIFTSPTAVLFGLSLLGSNPLPSKLRVCAVGAGTARALARNGIGSIAPTRLHNSEGLLAEPALAEVSGHRIALIDAPGGRDLLATALRERGAIVESIAVYQRKPPNLSERYLNALRNAERPWITLLSSGQALFNLLGALPADLATRWLREALVVSSQRLAEEAHERGFCDVHQAASALPKDLLAGAGAVLSRHRL